MHTRVGGEASTTKTNMVQTGRESFLARADANTSCRVILARCRVDKTERLSIKPLEQKILVKRTNRYKVTAGIRTMAGILCHLLGHGATHLGVLDVRLSFAVTAGTVLARSASTTLTGSRVRIGSAVAGQRLGISPTPVRACGARSTCMCAPIHNTRTNTAGRVRCSETVRYGMLRQLVGVTLCGHCRGRRPLRDHRWLIGIVIVAWVFRLEGPTS